MAVPAAAATLRASTYPNIRHRVASAFEAKTAIVTLGGGDATAMDAELKAYERPGDGVKPFPDGNATTEAALAKIVENHPEDGDAWVLIVNRYVYGKLS